MQHLSEDDLARLVDEAAEPWEAAHLAACERCGAELEALREQTLRLAEIPDLVPPEAGWEALEARLEEEALLRLAPRRAAGSLRLLRIAAALLIFAVGGAAGALARGGPPAGAAGGAARGPRDVSEAEARLRSAESAYLVALTQYSELTGAGRSADPVNRLAALEGIVLTTRAALQDAPADPVINGYHLAALSQRDALLRQLSSARTTTKNDQPWY